MLCKYYRLVYDVVFTFSIAFHWLFYSDESKHMQINSAKDSVFNVFNSRIMQKWIKSRSFTDDIFFNDEIILNIIISILKHIKANESRDSITKTDVQIATATSFFINDSNNQFEKSESNEDNDKENWDQWLVFCFLTWMI